MPRYRRKEPGEDEKPKKHNDKLKTKEYEKELAKLHVELVKLQEWVKFKGLKVCIVFEGPRRRGEGRNHQGASPSG